MKKWLLLLLLYPALLGFSTEISFPEFDVYSEYNSLNRIWSSYNVDMLFDTGLKYGLRLGMGFQNYNITSFYSNMVNISSIKVYASPLENFSFGYFLGKNTTLGNTLLGYRGFQFHQRPHMEYIGYKNINGSGIEAYMGLMDNTFEPHFYIYQPSSPVSTNTNLTISPDIINFDNVDYIRLENYTIEIYVGAGQVSMNTSNTTVTNYWQKHLGFFVKTMYGKVDFLMGLYAPDSPLDNIPPADQFYLNVTEHIVVGNFEQTFSLFTRPSSYNEYSENISNDLDIYVAIGAKIENFGFGVENSFLISSNYLPTDRAGVYFYFLINNLQYKMGGYYNIMGDAFVSKYGGFVSITGNL